MNSLRFLLVHRSPARSDAISELLTRANHSVLPTAGLEEAADALTIERFDAVLMESAFYSLGLSEFSAKLGELQNGALGVKIPVIGLGSLAGESAENDLWNADGLDAVLSEPIDPDALTAAVTKLAQAVSAPSSRVIDPDKFREQVGFDNELMVEIIDLFLEERQRQEPEMRQALLDQHFEVLSRLAHTIKGSLGSLHAIRARSHAQELELAARQADANICWQSLAALEADLAELEPELLALRQA